MATTPGRDEFKPRWLHEEEPDHQEGGRDPRENEIGGGQGRGVGFVGQVHGSDGVSEEESAAVVRGHLPRQASLGPRGACLGWGADLGKRSAFTTTPRVVSRPVSQIRRRQRQSSYRSRGNNHLS